MHQLLSLVWLRLALRGGKAEWREELLLDYTSSYAQFNGQFKFEAIFGNIFVQTKGVFLTQNFRV
jgi:hypothetical protein